MTGQGKQLKTFSVDYVDNDQNFVPGKFQPESDNKYIDIMHNYLRSDHYRTVIDSEQLLNELENATVARDLPGMADVDYSLSAFCKEIRKDLKCEFSDLWQFFPGYQA